MRNSKIVKIGDHGEVTVKELTVAELDALFANREGYQATWLDRVLDNDCLTGALLSMATGLSEDVLACMTPSALRPLVDAFKEVNPDFFEAARLEKSRADEILKMLEGNSDAAAACLSGLATKGHGSTD